MPLLADRYELAEPLGAGGMARVVAATDQRLQRRVAVKLVHDHLVTDDNARARLLHEARVAAAFHHPCAVAVFDVGVDHGQPFVVMELVAGETLADRLSRQRTLSAADVAAIGASVLDALAAAHRRGLVHRDVKPGNVLLPDEGGVKLTDFGIAKGLRTSSSALTATGEVVGTPAYLSPEQAGGDAATARSDLYALGVVLYECLSGAPPFAGDSAVAVAVAHQQQPVAPLAPRSSGAPPALAAAIERALAKEPSHRYHDAHEMRAAIAQAADEITAPPTIVAPPATVPLTVTGADRTAETAAPEPAPGRRLPLTVAAVAALLGALALAVALAGGGDVGDGADPGTGPAREQQAP